MTTTSSFILILLARRISAAVSLCFSAMFMSGSLELMSIRSRSPPRSQREAVNVAPSRCCGGGGRNGFPECRFKDVDVLLNGAAAYRRSCQPSRGTAASYRVHTRLLLAPSRSVSCVHYETSCWPPSMSYVPPVSAVLVMM